MMRRSGSETAIPERSSETHRGPSPPNSMLRRSASASGALIDEEQFEELTAVFDHSAVGNLATSVVSFVKDHVRHPAVAPAARSPSPTTHANHHQPTRPVSHIDLGHYHPGARHYAWLKWASSHSDWRLHLQLFLDDPSRSLAARAFSLAITAAILAQALLMMVETGSWGAVPDDCATWVAGWVLTAFFSVEVAPPCPTTSFFWRSLPYLTFPCLSLARPRHDLQAQRLRDVLLAVLVGGLDIGRSWAAPATHVVNSASSHLPP